MKILMVSSEVFPYAKVGGLGDVLPHLSTALSAQGHEVKILMPRYYSIDRVLLEKHPAPLGVQLGDHEYWTGIYHQTIPGSKVEIYFLDHEDMYGRDGVYGEQNREDYPDNLRRFALLSRAAFQLCRLLGWFPDIFHSHDWPTAPVMSFLKSHERRGEFLHSRGVFSIHNFGYQGIFPPGQLGDMGYGAQDFHSLGFEYHGKINLVKSALRCADAISTVSPHYAEEIMEPAMGFGLDGVLRERSDSLSGILNGMDYSQWNPENDQLIPYPYGADDLENKALNKNFIQQESGMEISSRPPLIGMVSRLVAQKGFDLLLGDGGSGLRRILSELDLQLIILGTGDPQIEAGLTAIARDHKNLRVYIRYNEKMSHVIQAGSDFFLMPSLYEPCGLTQMYAMRYGSLPVVSPTGGLVDTVNDVHKDALHGTGIIMDEDLSESSLFESLARAVELYQKHRSLYRQAQQRAMARRFTWEEAAKSYEELYLRALQKS